MTENPYQAPYDEGYADGVAATIERCAQVAESFSAYDHPARPIADAIRALKDSP